MNKLIDGPDGKPRCGWCGSVSEFYPYHDMEWGYPVADDIRLFEKLCLESFQSGLSWRTILVKRENFRRAFKQFNFHKMAKFKDADVERLLLDSGIVRHRGKIEAVINNAQQAVVMCQQEGSLASYFWSYEPQLSDVPEPQTVSTSAASEQLSKDLKKRGWKFVGPTTVYSFMQAMGMINDHVHGCVIREKVSLARKKFKRP